MKTNNNSNPQSLQEFPGEILVHIAGHLADMPASIVRLMMCSRFFYNSLGFVANISSKPYRVAIDKIWKEAANQFCSLTLTNGPYGPAVGSGELFTWFTRLATWGNRNPSFMHESTQQLQLQLQRLGGPEAINTQSRADILDLMRELAERCQPLPASLASYHVTLTPGTVIFRIDDECPLLFVQRIDRNMGDIELVNPLFFEGPIYLTRGELHVICACRTMEEGSVKDHILTAYLQLLRHPELFNADQLRSDLIAAPLLNLIMDNLQ